MGKSFNDSAITRILLSHRFADGGSMDSDKSDRPISQQKRDVHGVTEFNAGGSHEENPYGGVPQGIAPDGAPNLVEQGEVKLSDIIGQDNQYILSNRIMVDAEHARQFNIPESVVGMTYAAAFKKLYQPLKERSSSTEVKNEIAHLANAFMQAQDAIKAEQEAQQASAIMQSLPPEQQQQMMQMAMGQQGGQTQGQPQQGMPQQGQPSPEEQQAMMQQQMAQQDPNMMGGQQMPPEAMMQQGGQPSPEEMAMMQQQNPMAAQQPMMARGGKLYNQFSKGGNMKFNNNMFGGIFSHRFDNGGAVLNADSLAAYSLTPDTAAISLSDTSSVPQPKVRKPVFFNVYSTDNDSIYLSAPDGTDRTISRKDLADAIATARADNDSTRLDALLDVAEQIKYVDKHEQVPSYDFDRTKYWSETMPKLNVNKNGDITLDRGDLWNRFLGWNGNDKESRHENYVISADERKNTNALNELARAVINGEFGTGHYRKAMLGALYPEVMRRVNYRLKNGIYPSENYDFENENGETWFNGEGDKKSEGYRKSGLGTDYYYYLWQHYIPKDREAILAKYSEDSENAEDPLTMNTDSIRSLSPDSLSMNTDSIRSLSPDSLSMNTDSIRSLSPDSLSMNTDSIYDELMGDSIKEVDADTTHTSTKQQAPPEKKETKDKSNSGDTPQEQTKQPQESKSQQKPANESIEGKSTEELASLVLKGKLGNGKARKEALGDKYAEVQKLVNEKIKKYKAYKEKVKAKKAKVPDERGGIKEVTIPGWVNQPDPIENRVEDKTNSGYKGYDQIRNETMRGFNEESARTDDALAQLEQFNDKNRIRNAGNGEVDFDELVRRARTANARVRN